MTEERARAEAQAIANRDGIVMAVTFDPWAEYETDRWGYCPEATAAKCFPLEEMRATLRPKTVCPNCDQWQHNGGDCLNECRKRGFA